MIYYEWGVFSNKSKILTIAVNLDVKNSILTLPATLLDILPPWNAKVSFPVAVQNLFL